MTMQYVIIGLVLIVCLALAGRWFYRSLTNGSSACEGCALKDACAKKGQQENCNKPNIKREQKYDKSTTH